MKRIFGLLLLFIMQSSHAVDTTVRVLGIHPTGTGGVPGTMVYHIQSMDEAWRATGLHTSSGVSVQLLNGGVPIEADLSTLPTLLRDTPRWAATHPPVVQLRDQYAADVVVVFTDASDLCGAVQGGFINGNFLPTNGVDLRYKDISHVIAISTDQICWGPTGAHEFGHVFGGGHVAASMQDNPRLYPDSRAYVRLVEGDWYPYNLATALGAHGECTPHPTTSLCFFELRYSNNSPQAGNGDQQNARTLRLTALSVANYYQVDPPGPEPILNPPVNVHGFNLGCNAANETRHDIYWSPHPATNVEVTEYQIWYSQPPDQLSVYGWSLPAYQEFDDAYVFGADAQVTIRACTTERCSADSASYLARWTCF